MGFEELNPAIVAGEFSKDSFPKIHHQSKRVRLKILNNIQSQLSQQEARSSQWYSMGRRMYVVTSLKSHKVDYSKMEIIDFLITQWSTGLRVDLEAGGDEKSYFLKVSDHSL